MNLVFVGRASSPYLSAYDLDGEQVWTSDLAVEVLRLHVYGNRLLWNNDGALGEVDMETGAALWDYSTGVATHDLAVDDEGNVWTVGGFRKLRKLSPTGEPLANYDLGEDTGGTVQNLVRGVAYRNGNIYCGMSENTRLIRFDIDQESITHLVDPVASGANSRHVHPANGRIVYGALHYAPELADEKVLSLGGPVRGLASTVDRLYTLAAQVTATNEGAIRAFPFSDGGFGGAVLDRMVITPDDGASLYTMGAAPGVYAARDDNTLHAWREPSDEQAFRTGAIAGIRAVAVFTDLPPTPEEIFRATFAEASGSPPYMTAVNNAGAVQRLINHNVSLWAGKPGSWKGSPRVYRVPVEHIGYGELHKVTVGNVVDIKVNQPGLENTKRMKIQAIDAPLRSGPVTLTCIGWDSDD